MNKETQILTVFLITMIVVGIIIYIYFLYIEENPAADPAAAVIRI
tara:strand:- start:224 stop:358 length:135 start_codon:yes stop_codon:yes gene_type:complete